METSFEADDGNPTKRFKRYRSRHAKKEQERSKLREMIFLRDLHFGFLPDDCEREFADCFLKITRDVAFASKCFRLALLSRNEDLVRILLDQLDVTKENFHVINSTFLENLILEAVELDDFEAVQSILAWRDLRASDLGLTEVDKKLLKMQKRAQEVIVAAAVKNNYTIVKLLFTDGYKIIDRCGQGSKNFYNVDPAGTLGEEDVMETHIERIRSFRAMASPAYMAMTYSKDPVEHAFDFTKKADLGMQREPEFKSDYTTVRTNCRQFAVDVLDSCRNSAEVEQVLSGPAIATSRPYFTLYRALHEDQKGFVSHPYCQVLLHNKWLGRGGSKWDSMSWFRKILEVFKILLMAPVLCPLYILSPYRDHSKMKGPLWKFLHLLDMPIHRYILDMASYGIFLVFILLSVIHGIGDHKKRERTWYFNFAALWIVAHFAKDISTLVQVLSGRIMMTKFRFCYAILMDILFITAIGFKIYGYEFAIKNVTGSLLFNRVSILPVNHPINIGANIYGVAACMAFLKVIFLFEIHYRFGPILFCIKNVFWDILSIIGSFFITVFAFGVGLVSVFGIFEDGATHFSDFSSAFKTLFWIIFDPGKEEYADIGAEEEEAAHCCCRNATAPTLPPRPSGPFLRPAPHPGLSQATLRPPTSGGDFLSHKFGIYIWAFYQIFVVIIMLNLLISLMTTTFAKIQQNADVEWKFTRASIWIHYYDDLNSIPCPLNLIPSVHSIMKIVRKCANRGQGYNGTKSWTSSKLIAQESKRRLYDTLIERVFRSERKKEDSKVGRSDIEALEKEISIDIADLRRDIRNLRKDIKLPTAKFVTPRDGYTTRKISAALLAPPARNLNEEDDEVTSAKASSRDDLQEDSETDSEREKRERRRKKRWSKVPFKVDNSPEVVEHLVQTLGLIGVRRPLSETNSLEPARTPERRRSSLAPSRTPERRSSLV